MNLLDLLMIPGLDNSKEIERLIKQSKERMRKPNREKQRNLRERYDNGNHDEQQGKDL